jgi:hypothetical protein
MAWKSRFGDVSFSKKLCYGGEIELFTSFCRDLDVPAAKMSSHANQAPSVAASTTGVTDSQLSSEVLIALIGSEELLQ